MNKAKNLEWFNDNMKSKMLKHEENPLDMTLPELFNYLIGEVEELQEALYRIQIEKGQGNDLEKIEQEIILECADVANYALFIADKIKRGA